MEYPAVGIPGILWDRGFLGGHPGGLVIVGLFQEDPTSLPAKTSQESTTESRNKCLFCCDPPHVLE